MEKKMVNRKNISILFVEDEVEVRKNYCNILQKEFKNVYEASNGEEALKIFLDKLPEILIVDINLPKMNGLDFIKKVREKSKNTKIIILSAHTDVKYLFKAVELYLVKYLVKPVKRNEFNEAIDIAIEQLQEYDVVDKKLLYLDENFTWSFDEVTLYKDLKEVDLTKSEKLILNTLFSNPNTELTYDDIIYAVWGDFDSTRKDTLKTMINNLRKKIPSDTIKTMYKIGYKFNN
jgi:DNA-binding response OmpR family regulator